MSQTTKKQDYPSDSDLSLQLSDASSLSSDSDLLDSVHTSKKKQAKKPKKKTNKKKNIIDNSQYCTCRKGYDGKEFMIECDGCQEWFHGACVGLKPNSVTDHYYCKSCTSKRKRPPPISAGKTLIPPPKSMIVLPISKSTNENVKKPSSPPKQASLPSPIVPVISEDEDEDLDDICVLCDGDCTCGAVEPTKIQTKIIIPVPEKPIPTPKKTGKAIPSSKMSKKTKMIHHSTSEEETSTDDEDVIERVGTENKPKKSTVKRGKSATLLANMKAPTSRKGKGKKMSTVKYISSEEDSDQELIVDDLDDLLETMSPLSEHSSDESDLQSQEEFFTDDEQEQESMSPTSYGSSIHIDSGDDEDIENEETQKIINELTLDSDEQESDIDDQSGIFVEDDEDDDEIEEEEEEEEEEHIPNYYHHRHSHWSSDDDDEEDEEFDYTTIPEEEENDAFLPLLDSEGNLYDSIAAAFMQAFSMHADTTTTTAQPSGTTTPAAVTLGEDYQLSPFELANALTALSATEHVFLRRPSLPSSTVSAAQRMRGSQDLSTSDLREIVSNDLTLSLEPIEEEEGAKEVTNHDLLLDLKPTRPILPKPSGSGDSYFPNMSSQTALEQHIQQVLGQSIENTQSQKRKSTSINEPIKKSKKNTSPTSPTAENEEVVSMDDLVDTSQLYTRSLSRSPSPDISEDDNPYSRDLNRWQRIPIGAFRLLRSKNKLWLER